MKKSLKLFLSYVLPLVMVGLLIGMVVFSTVLQTKRSVEYDYARDVRSVSMNEKVIRVVSDIDYAPFSYVDADGNPSGHDIELIYAIAKKEGYNVQLSMMTWNEAQSEFKEGKYDVLLTADYNLNGEDDEFSSPICSDPFIFYGRKGTTISYDLSTLRTMKIASLKSGSAENIYFNPLGLEDTVTYYDTLTDAFKDVNSGKMDLVVASTLSGRHIISSNKLDMEQIGNDIYENTQCFMIDEDNEEIRNAVNSSILIFQSNGVMDSLNKKWFEDYQPDITLSSLVEQNKAVFILIGAIFILVIYTLFFMLTQFSKQKEKRMSETSVVTGLPNLSAFRRISEEIVESDPDEEYVIVRIDIDHFKLYNDVYGTEAGDKLLYKIGQVSADVIKKTRKEILIGHVSGDQFVLFMKLTDFSPIRLYNICQKNLQAINPNYNFAVRIGYCKVDDPNVDIAIYCDWAYLAQKSIKGDYVKHWAEYDRSMRQHILEEREIAGEMAEALDKGQFVPYFQPQLNYQTKKISGAEVLARWIHPEKGIISPGKFIPVFEKNGFIYELDKYIWRQACIFLKKAEETGLDIPCLSVNISRRDIYRDDLLATLNSLIREYDLDKKKIHLEITESAYTENPELLIKVVSDLGKDGYIVEMDDFGSGYSSLTVLKDLPFEVVKLDMAFQRNTGTSGKTGNILSSIVHMAHQINTSIIAEGVETVEQAQFLHSIGCNNMQGYLFSKPMDKESFISYLKNADNETTKEKTVQSFNNSTVDFLDNNTQESLLFNSFMGSACLMEIQGERINILRVNEHFFEELNLKGKADFDMLTDLSSKMDEKSLSKFFMMAKEAIETGNEVTGELHLNSLVNSGSDVWILLRARCIGKKVDSYLFFCSVENISEIINLGQKNNSLLNELDNIISNLPGGIARFRHDPNSFEKDKKVFFEFMSNGFAAIRGYTVDELTEKLNNNGFISEVHPDDINRLLAAFNTNLEANREMSVKYRIKKKDGSYIWVNTHSLNRSADKDIITYLYCVDISDEKDIEEKLKANEATLSSIMSSVSGGTIIFEFDGKEFRIIEVSEGIAAVVDRTSAEFRWELEHNIQSLLYEQDAEKVFNSIVYGAETGKDSDISFRVKKGNEEPIWIRMHCEYERKDNGSIIARCILRDISSVSELYQNVINETETGLIVIDKNTHETIFANRAGAAIFEMLPEKLIGKQCYDYCWGKDIHCKLWTENIPEEGLVIEDDYKGRHYRILKKSVYWNGIDAIITYYEDRTEVTAANKQFSKLVANLPCGVSILAHNGNKIIRSYISEVGKKILEIDDTDRVVSSSVMDDAQFVYPDDFNKYISTIERCSQNNESFTIEVRLLSKTGTIKWVELSGQPFYSKEEQKQFVFLTYSDISLRKASQEEIVLKETEYLEAANQSNRMICKYTLDGRILTVPTEVANKYDSVTYLKNAPEEFIKRGYIAPDSIERWNNFFKMIDDGEQYGEEYEISISTLSGLEFRCYNASFKAIHNEYGKSVVAILSFEDITDRKAKDRTRMIAYKAVLKALSKIYPVSVACNTNENSFKVLDNDNHFIKTVNEINSYDELIKSISKFIPSKEQKDEFISKFSCQGINNAWASEKESISLEHQQLDNNGNVHWMESKAIEVADPEKKDNLHIFVSKVIDERKEKEMEIKKELDESISKISIDRQISAAIDNISEAGTTIFIYDIKTRTMHVPSWYAEKYGMESEIMNYPNPTDSSFAKRFINDEELKKYCQIFDNVAKGITTGGTIIGMSSNQGTSWGKIRTAIVRNDSGEIVKAVIAIEDNTEKHEKEISTLQEVKRMQAIISAVAQTDVEYIGIVEKANGKYTLYSDPENDSESLKTADYDYIVRNYVLTAVKSEDQPDFLNNMALSNVLERLEKTDVFKYQFTTNEGRKETEFSWYDPSKTEIIVVQRSIQDKYLNEVQISNRSFVRDQLLKFEENSDIEDGINTLLENVGKYTSSDRAYLLNVDREYIKSNYEWHKPEVKALTDEFQNNLIISPEHVEKIFPNESIIFVRNSENIKKEWPQEYEVLKKNNIKSFIIFPLKMDGRIIAVIGLDNPRLNYADIINHMLFLFGKVLVEKIIAEKEKGVLLEENSKQSSANNTIISALSILNYATWLVDIDTNTLDPINDHEYADCFGEYPNVYGNARKTVAMLINNYVRDEDKDRISQFFDFDRIKNCLRVNENDRIEYLSKRKGWTRISIVPAADSDKDKISRIIVTFTVIAEEKQKEAEADEKLQQAISELNQANQDKGIDYLTGLNNRYNLYEMSSKNSEKISAVFMMDIDNFKDYNDSFGHVAGDGCLKKIGDKLSEYGLKNNMRFYRYGGEELLGLSFDRNIDAEKTATELVKLVRNLNIPTTATEYGVVTISLGYTTEGAEFEQKVSMADAALYAAKKAGKNQAKKYSEK